jgi:hypothetical protein
MANYRSAVQHVEQAKLRSIEQGRRWTDNMQLALDKVKRASNRGIGTPRATAPYPVPDIQLLENTQSLRCPGGPSWPKRVDLAGSWWACRSVELANAVVSDVATLTNGEISWELPSSNVPTSASAGPSRGHPQQSHTTCALVAHLPRRSHGSQPRSRTCSRTTSKSHCSRQKQELSSESPSWSITLRSDPHLWENPFTVAPEHTYGEATPTEEALRITSPPQESRLERSSRSFATPPHPQPFSDTLGRPCLTPQQASRRKRPWAPL